LKPGRSGKGAHHDAAMAAAATRISMEEVAQVTVGRRGRAQWGSGGRVARAWSEESLRRGEKREGVARCPFSGRWHVREEGDGGVRSGSAHVEEGEDRGSVRARVVHSRTAAATSPTAAGVGGCRRHGTWEERGRVAGMWASSGVWPSRSERGNSDSWGTGRQMSLN
jgi:hypothetical protein